MTKDNFKMPSCKESENIVLGYLLLEPSIYQNIREKLFSTDFYFEDNKIIYQTICEMKGKFDLATLKDELKKKSKLLSIGGAKKLADLLDFVVRGIDYKVHINSIINASKMRKIIKASYAITEKASNDGDFGGILEDARAIINLTKNRNTENENKIKTLRDLDLMDLPEPVWIIPGVIPEGLTILAGKPKAGKSNLVLSISLAVSTGGKALSFFPTNKRDVLYLGLEDTLRRLKDRSRALMPSDSSLPENFFFCTEWPRLPEGIEEISNHLDKHTETGLIVIDTFSKIRKPRTKNSDPYQSDYNDVSSLKTIADTYKIGIILVHHQRKLTSDDVFDTISGTFGITGGADTIMILRREGRSRADSILHVTGRDVEDAELALVKNDMDRKAILWEYAGDAQEFRVTKERQEIIEVLKQSTMPMSPKQIAKALGKNVNSITQLLYKMCINNEIRNCEYGKYHIYKR